MRKVSIVFIVFLSFVSYAGFAQVRSGGTVNTGGDELSSPQVGTPNFKPKLSLGVGVGFSNLYGDFPTSQFLPAARIGLGCRLTKALVVGVESYFGQLGSTQPANNWTAGFNETSNFASVDLNAKITVGNYLNYPSSAILRMLSGFYVGTGYGLVYSNISKFTGKFKPSYKDLNNELSTGLLRQNTVFTPYIPLNVGFRVHMKKFLGSTNAQFMINYQINYTFSDFVDGYSSPPSTTKNQVNDCYTVVTLGFSFYLTKD